MFVSEEKFFNLLVSSELHKNKTCWWFVLIFLTMFVFLSLFSPRHTFSTLNQHISAGCADSALPTCFVSVGHGVQSDVVKLGAGILVQHRAKLTKETVNEHERNFMEDFVSLALDSGKRNVFVTLCHFYQTSSLKWRRISFLFSSGLCLILFYSWIFGTKTWSHLLSRSEHGRVFLSSLLLLLFGTWTEEQRLRTSPERHNADRLVQ